MPSLLAHPDYTRERVRQVARRATALVHADARAPDRMRIAGPVDRIQASDAAALEYRNAVSGMALGPLWATWWLAVEGRVPAEWEGEQVDLLLVTNSEATLWLDGEPVQGLVSGGAYVRPDAMLTESAVAGEPLSATSRSPATASSGGPSSIRSPTRRTRPSRPSVWTAARSRASTARPGRWRATSRCWRR